MNLDWSVIWEYRRAFASGITNTVLLTFLTMVISIFGGIVTEVNDIYKLIKQKGVGE